MGAQNSLFVVQDYDMHILRPKNDEGDELEINKIGEKFQDNNEFILQNNIRNSRGNQITETIQGFDPPI